MRLISTFLVFIACTSHAWAQVPEFVLTPGKVTAAYYDKNNGKNGVTSSQTPFIGAGNTGSAYQRLFEQFALPALAAGSTVDSAILYVSAKSDAARPFQPLRVFGTEDWTTIATYYKQPAITTGVLATVSATPTAAVIAIDLTDYVNAIYQSGGNRLNLAIKSISENTILADSIRFMPGQHLDLSVSAPSLPPVPEPPMVAMFLAGGLLFAYRARRKN